MKNFKSILLTVIIALVVTSCSDDKNKPVVAPVVSKEVKNLHAPQNADYTQNPPVISGDFTKFSFAKGEAVTGDNWDIAFRGTAIIVNGGTTIGLTDEPSRTGAGALTLETGTFASITTAPSNDVFKQDAQGAYALPTGSNNGWYTYNTQTHSINPIAGKVLVVKTHNGHYAKMEILSYYKDGTPSRDTSRYYTFNYVYNPNVGDKNLQ